MCMELISVVVPAYNCAQWLPRCLDSLMKQSHTRLEIIVINDGSADNTAAVLDAYAAKDPRIKAVHKENGGVTSARLLGVAMAEGDWIGFADADDAVAPDMYERLLKNAQDCGADISHCSFRADYSGGKRVEMGSSGSLLQMDHNTALRHLLEERIVEPALWNKIYRKNLFVGLAEKMDCSIRTNEDMLMNYYLFSQADRSEYEDSSLYYYWIREDSASRRKLNHNRIYDPIRVRQILLDHCPRELKEDARRAYVRICLIVFRELAMEPGNAHETDRVAVQELIRQQLPYRRFLPRRNALLVWLVSQMPGLVAWGFQTFGRFIG